MTGRSFTTAMLALVSCLLVSAAVAQRPRSFPEDREMDQGYQGKICSASSPHTRDTINVPVEWTVEDCRTFASSVGGATFQLGCIFAGTPKLAWGTFGGGIPQPDCGWAPGERRRDERRLRERPFDDRQFDDRQFDEPDRPRRRF